jgi:hypothetical protein
MTFWSPQARRAGPVLGLGQDFEEALLKQPLIDFLNRYHEGHFQDLPISHDVADAAERELRCSPEQAFGAKSPFQSLRLLVGWLMLPEIAPGKPLGDAQEMQEVLELLTDHLDVADPLLQAAAEVGHVSKLEVLEDLVSDWNVMLEEVLVAHQITPARCRAVKGMFKALKDWLASKTLEVPSAVREAQWRILCLTLTAAPGEPFETQEAHRWIRLLLRTPLQGLLEGWSKQPASEHLQAIADDLFYRLERIHHSGLCDHLPLEVGESLAAIAGAWSERAEVPAEPLAVVQRYLSPPKRHQVVHEFLVEQLRDGQMERLVSKATKLAAKTLLCRRQPVQGSAGRSGLPIPLLARRARAQHFTGESGRFAETSSAGEPSI